jgi:hypothetical protein
MLKTLTKKLNIFESQKLGQLVQVSYEIFHGYSQHQMQSRWNWIPCLLSRLIVGFEVLNMLERDIEWKGFENKKLEMH